MLIDDIVNESGAFFYDCINDAIPFITDPAPSVTGKGSRPPLLEESNTCPLDCSFPCITVIIAHDYCEVIYRAWCVWGTSAYSVVNC